MPRFVVIFNEDVVYLPDHPKGTRSVPVLEGLRVSAPTPQGAMLHATRTTRGAGGPTAVYSADTGELLWGHGPEAIVVPPVTPPAVESTVGEVAEVFGA